MSTPQAPGEGPAGQDNPAQGGGLIGLFARHATAANLLMAIMAIAGLFALGQLNRQFFPDFGIEIVQVTVAWPGASAEDVDANIVQAIEPEVRYLDGVDQVTTRAVEGTGIVTIEYLAGSDMQKALSEVESAVAQVTTLPEDAERPTVRRIVRYDEVARLVVSGPYSEASLIHIARGVRDELLARGIDRVTLTGVRDPEVWIEVMPETLRWLGMTLDDIAGAIGQANRDIPAGSLTGGERQVRSLGQERDAEGLRDLTVKALSDGTQIRLSDVAVVRDTFEDSQVTLMRGPHQAIEMRVERSVTADALNTANIVNRYLESIEGTLPPNLEIAQYAVTAELIRDRIRVLVENGAGGLALVLLVLFLFLNARIAFWVAVGIPVSMLATMAIMLLSGQSINMISLFGLIMAIGIVVDDAIVVSEHSDALAARGMRPLHASLLGARRMAAPVVSSTLTTIAAFLPLFVIGGIIGDIISAIPFVVVAVLIASLIECFLVLPTHMRHALRGKRDHRTSRFRTAFDRGFARFRDGPFRAVVATAISWRYATVAAAFGSLLLAMGLLAGGRLTFEFFPTPEADVIYAGVEMVAGTPRDATEEAVRTLEAALERTAARLEAEGGMEEPGRGLVVMSLGAVGKAFGENAALQSSTSTDTLGGLYVELAPADRRAVRTREVIEAWRAEIPPIPGLKTLTLRAPRGGPPGRDLDVRLIGQDVATLKQAAEALRGELTRFPGVSDIEDNLPYGKPETILELSDRGRALGFTTASVAAQVRGALEGAIAQRFPRGDDEVTVRVLYPEEITDAGILETMHLRSPAGTDVPLDEVVTRRQTLGFAQVQRVDGRRQVAVTAELDSSQTTTAQMMEALLAPRPGQEDKGARGSILGQIADTYGVSYTFKGRSEEQAETIGDMRTGALLGLVSIYLILAWVFGSYARPLAVMLTIPLGLIGAFLGHYLLGFNVTILSMIAMIGLSGIIINDSIVLITTIDERKATQNPYEAIVDGSCDRLRAVLLTSLTTIGGLAPLIFETSLQAQFLIPMAITIVFGLAVGTALVLLVVPSLVAIQEDVRHAAAWVRGRPAAQPAE
ncbi:MAG: efflux RND transporter permease subunit [Alphaproteobacteria bacterium]|nr:efflux RND transporter permease subunit [Alphaproteobacteria bacterium]MDX5368018.1 efflux RND transporter permease subunit [Alphaproteobacteria bacterium]MDX5462865.1 efflux RND transporter permease subunit [Alphaproteobacteria bacterium]